MPKQRSSSVNSTAAVKAGKTSSPSSVDSTVLHTKTGSLVRLSPGARMVSTVTKMLTAPNAIDRAKSTIVTQYASMPRAAWSASGA